MNTNGWIGGVSVLSLLALGGIAEAAADAAPVIAVFDIQDTRARNQRLSRDALKSMRDYLANQLAEDGVFKVVPSSDIQAALRQGQAKSFEACYDEACQIEIGKEIAAQKSLATKISQFDTECVVSATLYDLRESATDKAGSAKGACGQTQILKLLETVAKKLRAGREPKPLQGLQVKLQLESVPPGAEVLINDKQVCAETTDICHTSVAPGSYMVKMNKSRFDSKMEVIVIKAEKEVGPSGTGIRNVKLSWRLVSQFGVVNVKTRPSGLALSVNGEAPVKKQRFELMPGLHSAKIMDACHEAAKGASFTVKKNETTSAEIAAVPRMGAIQVKVMSNEGRELSAKLSASAGLEPWSVLGTSPLKASVWRCAEAIRVSHDGYEDKLIKLDSSNWPAKPLEVVLEGTHPFPWLATAGMVAGAGLTSAGLATGVGAVSDAERGAVSARDSALLADTMLWTGLTSLVASAVWFWVEL